MSMSMLAAALMGYLLGSIPFGLLLTRFAGLGDIRSIGSGNIGATNVLRTGNKGLAAGTLALDLLKGTVAVIAAGVIWSPGAALIAGIAAFLGHHFPVWLKFQGGKGVATYIGVLLAWTWTGALVYCAVWLATAAITRYSSLAALIAAVVAPIYIAYRYPGPIAVAAGVMSALLIAKHHANIRRLMNGEEPRIGAKNK